MYITLRKIIGEGEMEDKLSKFIYITDSYDNKSKLLYNSKSPYFVKYSKKILKN